MKSYSFTDPKQQAPAPSLIRRIFAGVAALIAALFALGASWWITILLRGRNSSDVGVPIYPSGGLALAAGWAVYIIMCLGLVWTVARTLGRGSSVAYGVGLPAWGVGMILNLIVLTWLAG
ncbi:MAG: hypothetical protein M3Z04_08790 [Chloroflexota bacterium]|nr:hypothetical protein [Chloroflexota bacterium]